MNFLLIVDILMKDIIILSNLSRFKKAINLRVKIYSLILSIKRKITKKSLKNC